MHASISDFVLDIVSNSIEADASNIQLFINMDNCCCSIEIVDNGKGMKAETLKKVQDPFYTDGEKHTNRHVGLGIPFVIQAVELCNGSFDISSKVGVGTKIRFSFDITNVDTPPMGDLVSAIVMLMGYPGNFELTVNYKTMKGESCISKTELLEALDNLEDISNIQLAKAYIHGLIDEIQ